MTSHSQDRGTALFRALRSIPAHAFDPRVERIVDNRNPAKEYEASKLYAQLRSLSKEQLRARAGWLGGRQEMIASIIMREVYEFKEFGA